MKANKTTTLKDQHKSVQFSYDVLCTAVACEQLGQPLDSHTLTCMLAIQKDIDKVKDRLREKGATDAMFCLCGARPVYEETEALFTYYKIVCPGCNRACVSIMSRKHAVKLWNNFIQDMQEKKKG